MLAADRRGMENIRTARRPTYALAAFVVLCVLWWSFLRGVRVPILGFVDLAVHEAGHVFFFWAPTDVMLAMGNGFQTLVPLVFTVAFVVRHRDLAGGAATLAWAASSLQDASVYIADAPVRLLPLLGPETSHDWWQLLGRHGWLGAADELSRVVWLIGLLTWLLAVAVLVVGVRWDAEWMDGAAGTIYRPWDRILESGDVRPQALSAPGGPSVPPGWDDVPWGSILVQPPADDGPGPQHGA